MISAKISSKKIKKSLLKESKQKQLHHKKALQNQYSKELNPPELYEINVEKNVNKEFLYNNE